MPAPFTTNPAAYAHSTFMGAKVKAFNTSIGWNMSGPSQLRVQLVDDPVYGAEFSPPDVGTPVYFTVGAFTFNGLFQQWERRRDTSGNPVYEAVVVDPREILDGAQVIIGGYSGSIGSVKNLFNAYGYWESQAYGASLATDAGMPWNMVRDAVLAMANSPAYGSMGGPLTFRGNAYSLDLSEVPSPPSYYRFGGLSIGLLEAIAQVCEDGGCDFFVELQGFTIKVRTVSRISQPPLGVINAIADTNWGGSVVRTTNGIECRNELTSAFLVGGEVSTLWSTDAIQSFWGYDIDGAPILGRAAQLQLKDKDGAVIDTFDTEEMNLNASPVADIIGAVSYQCTTLEMRLAQANQESWLTYMTAHRNALATMIGLVCPFENKGGQAQALQAQRPDFVNAKVAQVALAVQGDAQERSNRMYEFVRGYADEYMGRKFLVGLPFVLSKIDPETTQLTTSWEVSDGGYLPEGSQPLGLAALNEDLLKTPDGRFRAFVTFPDIADADLSKISPQGAVIQDGVLYQECQVDPQIIFLPEPTVVISLSGPITDREVEPQGNSGVMGAVLQMAANIAEQVMKKVALPHKVAPATQTPAAVSVPLKSNILTYGPWAASGAPGKVRFEQDPSLTPWNYGGYVSLALAGEARVTTAITNMQVSETGTVELAGTPGTNLGNVLQAGGPNVTGIDVQFGTDGVTTSYRFQTFTARYGVLSKAYIERFKRASLAAVEIRRSMRAAINNQAEKGRVLADANRAAKAWRQHQAKAAKKETPHDVFQVYCAETDDGEVRVNPSMTTMEESTYTSSPDSSSDYKRTAIMGLGGLIRPFATSSGGGTSMPAYVTPSVGGLNKSELDPWKDTNDIEVFSYGTSYTDIHARDAGVAGSDARVFGLRAPLVLVGWGYGTENNYVPGDESDWDEDYLTNQANWKAGPMDPLWDERRGVWTVHGFLKGTTSSAITAGGEGTVDIECEGGGGYSLEHVQNFFSSDVDDDTKVVIAYIATDNLWYVIAADCS